MEFYQGRESLNILGNHKLSVCYHDIFDYPLTALELIKWQSTGASKDNTGIARKGGFYFIGGREGLIYKRILRKRVSAKKLKIARKASKLLAYIPTVKMVAVTGSLAMQNSTDDSDIDLMIVTRSGQLWMTRLLTIVLLTALRMPSRRAGRQTQKDKLCMNMWFDENDLVWRSPRNFYTAHEIAQIVPLVNKDSTYERLLFKNKWILRFWPNAVRIRRQESGSRKSVNWNPIEKLAYWIQYQYMKPKVTREVITPTRAVFHPQDWGKLVLDRLKSYQVE